MSTQSTKETQKVVCPHGDGCSYETESLTSLSVHWRKKHSRTAEELRLVLFHNGVRPTCRCGCGGVVKFMGIQVGFTEWIRGHVARVRNSWGHNKAAREKSLETRRGMFERRELTTWNSGLTKESDVRAELSTLV